MKHHRQPPFLLLSLLPTILSLQPLLAFEFLFNGFEPSNISLYGIAKIESKIITLTNQTSFSIGRALYSSKIQTKDPNSSLVLPFSTSFVFSMAPNRDTLPGHGIVFLFAPYSGIQNAAAAQNLGFLNRTNDRDPQNPVFGIEFDVFENEEFSDINGNHVGINLNSLTSTFSHEAGYYTGNENESFRGLELNNGKNYQAWIDYADFNINVTMALAGMERPIRPLMNFPINLSQVLGEEMYVGFTAATGALVQSHRILSWSFSHTNFSLSEALVTTDLPSFELPGRSVFRSKWFIAGMTIGVFVVCVACSVFALLWVRRNKRGEEIEEWELEYWPHRIPYREIDLATKGFSEENVIGIGGNGKVYKAVLAKGAEVAVKVISHDNSEGMREFLAEVSSLGRLKHRNLVGLRGWCKKEKGSLILVYDYMENGSLDKRVFDCDERKLLSWEERIRILKNVASGVLYLHEEWEVKVLHRDIKASNVLLDKEMSARLGDFGLARMHGHGQAASTTRVIGTVGYLAPEVVKTGRATTQTDVFSFGVLILEVICGRRPIEGGKTPLVDWGWELLGRGELGNALDEKLRRAQGGPNEEEVERVLHLGLLCAHPDPQARPTIRQVVKVLGGKNEAEGPESEGMDVYLLEKMKAREMWPKYAQNLGHGPHPTFDQIRQAVSSSMSLSWSDAIVEGR
ncbi:L-type lectin-domain containing receptor kinase VII.1-like [Actinidia eriantha]|uniref:L-type lectin-domain containing receptor kinase VII.1-like n=1 Tax=Actinidia eriantha TaxID=165200 RepID=UPI00258572A5|nr:L-type lectin-domain containing receptor kinase VII.1-like [Actinidia eriantha]